MENGVNNCLSIKYNIYTNLFIDGEFVQGTKNQTIPVLNPATEEKICEISEATEEDVEKAIVSAEKGFQAWSKVSLDERNRIFNKLADAIEASLDEFSILESMDNGKPFLDAIEDIKEVIRVIRYYGGLADKITGDTYTTHDSYTIQSRRVPYGVVGCISPWNYPLLMAAWKIFPAIAAGNSVVLKPSEETPLTVLRLAKTLQEIEFPRGVLNIVPGYGSVAGAYLTKHPRVDKISFTGSTAVGRQVMKSSSESNLKNVHLELGGKSPVVILADCDLDSAVTWAIDGAFRNTSQNCCCGSRILVERRVYDEFVKKLVEKTKEIKYGAYHEEGIFMGPVVNKKQHTNILKFIDHGKDVEKLELAVGGNKVEKKGYWIEPTIFTNVPDDSKLAREEIFGPVLCVLKPFDTLKEALERANDTTYGLASGVFTKDANKAEFFVRNIRSGTVWVNNYNMTSYNIPFGGMKQSGFGRDNGRDGLLEYTTMKAVYYYFDLSVGN
jgi:aldehyde dehydrogenase (NAD+)